MQKKASQFNVHDIAVIGLMSAMVFVFTMFPQIKVPTPLGPTMFHLGNSMCLLSALLFGKTRGGLAAGLGSMFYDLMDPVFLPECWVTFIMKFTMAFVAGAIACGGRKEQETRAFPPRAVLGAICGALTYVLLYLGKTYVKEYLIYKYEIQTVLTTMVTKGGTSLINAIAAVIVSLLLAAAIRPALQKSGFADKLGVR